MMRIEIRYDGKKYFVCLHKNGTRGYKGFHDFVSQHSAQATAEGIRFCFLKIGISVSSDYSKEEPLVPLNETVKKDFTKGMEIFYINILNTSREVCDKAIALMLP
ncbi:MAG: hypothetical protein WC694_02475 [Candidatus Paceibacterota bacterium]|jgi:hypothetical protein